jgi:hypothetical protein
LEVEFRVGRSLRWETVRQIGQKTWPMEPSHRTRRDRHSAWRPVSLPPADMIDMHDQAAIPRRQSLSRTTMRLQPAAGPHHRTRIALRPAHHVLLALSPTSAGARPHTYAGGLPGPRACPANRRLGLSCDCELRALAVTLYLFSACSSLFGSTRVFPAYCT